MKWIKASERLPEMRKVVFVKIEEKPGVGNFVVDGFNGEVRFWHNGTHESFMRAAFPYIEWLDESEPAPSPDLEAEAAKLYPYTDRKDQGAFEYNWSQDDRRKGYITAARRYASQVEELKAENERLRVALQKIANWELPPSGKYWDLLETDPMSYEAAYGSNGVRDYIKSIAANALKPKP